MIRLLLPAFAAAMTAVACGGDDRLGLTTPREEVGAPPIATPEPPATRERKPTQRDAERLRPVVSGWARALRRGDVDRAMRYFSLPLIVAQGNAVTLQTRDEVRAFLDALPCGARLVEVQHDGRYIVGTFRLTERPGRTCDGPGALTRVAFVVRRHKIAEWRRVPDARGARPGPATPEPAPPPGQSTA